LAKDWEDTIAEIDINPLMVLDKGRGVKALDALVVLKQPETG
jgi:succinyl-CoA synthetase beta subunit